MLHIVIIWLVLDAMAIFILMGDYQWYYGRVRKAALTRRQTARKHRSDAVRQTAIYHNTMGSQSHYDNESKIA